MTEQTFQYKGYTALIIYSQEDQCYTGKVIGIRHKIVFNGSTLEETHSNFIEMIDDYPTACADHGLEPIPPPDEIMIPIPTELYAKAAYQAEHKAMSIHTFMQNVIKQAVT